MTLSPSNTDRTQRAARVLGLYAELEGRAEELGSSVPTATLISDLLADLMHYASFWKLDIDNCIEVAQMHYEDETEHERAALPVNYPARKRIEALRRIARIPLWGEPITDPEQGDKAQLAEVGEYDLDEDCYEPCCDAESEWLRDAVETAREAIDEQGGSEPDKK